MSFKLTREQLYDLVWSEAIQKLGKQIGISDVALAKTCRKIGIPIPERGYWNRLHAGKKVQRTPLPSVISQRSIMLKYQALSFRSLLNRFRGAPGAIDPEGESIEVLTERFRKRLGNVSALRNFKNMHPIIAKYLAKDEEHRQKKLSEKYYWREPQFESPFERRRLCFLNSLLLGQGSCPAQIQFGCEDAAFAALGSVLINGFPLDAAFQEYDMTKADNRLS